MADQKMNTKLEEAITKYLNGETQENAMKFATYLNENDLAPVSLPYDMNNGNTIGAKIPYNGHYLGWFLITKNGEWLFQIFNYLDFGESIHSEEKDEEFKKTIHDHVSICGSPCHDQCWRAKDAKIFGKEFKSVCSQHSLDFVNPEGKDLEYIKKLLEYSKGTTPYVQQYHPTHL